MLGLVNLAITMFLADSVVIKLGGSALTLIGGTVFAVSILFAPKLYKVTHLACSPTRTKLRVGPAPSLGLCDNMGIDTNQTTWDPVVCFTTLP